MLMEVENHGISWCKKATKEGFIIIQFKYLEPISANCCGKHWLDDVNNRWHVPILLSDSWKTNWWPNRKYSGSFWVFKLAWTLQFSTKQSARLGITQKEKGLTGYICSFWAQKVVIITTVSLMGFITSYKQCYSFITR